MQTMKIHRFVLDGMLLAVMIICSQLTIPLPLIPITLQTFAVGIIASVTNIGSQLVLIFGAIVDKLTAIPKT